MAIAERGLDRHVGLTDAGTDTAIDDSKLGSRSDDDNARDDRQNLDPTPHQDRVGIGRVDETSEDTWAGKRIA